MGEWAPLVQCAILTDQNAKGITITLMLRSVGALISGSLGDRSVQSSFNGERLKHEQPALTVIVQLRQEIRDDRESVCIYCSGASLGVHEEPITAAWCSCLVWHCYGSTICIELLMYVGLTYDQGLLGPAAATALEDLPYDARGILSGLFQQGYAVGYLLAAVFYRALVPTTTHGWRSLFWFGAGPPILIIIWRLCLPETNYFLVTKAEREERESQQAIASGSSHVKTGNLRAFPKQANTAMRQNWVLFAYMVVLMTGYNSVSHGSQVIIPMGRTDRLRHELTLPPITFRTCSRRISRNRSTRVRRKSLSLPSSVR